MKKKEERNEITIPKLTNKTLYDKKKTKINHNKIVASVVCVLLYSLLEFSEKHKLLRHVNVINLNKNTKPRTCHFDEVHEQILKVLYPNKFVFSTKSCYIRGMIQKYDTLVAENIMPGMIYMCAS